MGNTGTQLNKIFFILWILFTPLIWLTLFMTCSITYECHWILQFPIWNNIVSWHHHMKLMLQIRCALSISSLLLLLSISFQLMKIYGTWQQWDLNPWPAKLLLNEWMNEQGCDFFSSYVPSASPKGPGSECYQCSSCYVVRIVTMASLNNWEMS